MIVSVAVGLFYQVDSPFRRKSSVDLVIYEHHGPVGAGGGAGGPLPGKPGVGGGALLFHLELFLHRLNDIRRALKVAGGTPAYLDGVLPRRGEAEVGVEGGHSIGLVDRGASEVGDRGYGFRGQIAQLLLDLDEGGEDRYLFLDLLGQGFVDSVFY